MAGFPARFVLDAARARFLTYPALLALQSGDFQRAAALTTRAIELCPRLAHAYALRAHARLEMGQCEDAINDCTIALSFDPGCHLAFNNRAVAHQRQQQIAEALLDFDCAVDLSPNDLSYLLNRANARREAHDPAGAIGDFLRVLQFRASAADAHLGLALAYQAIGKDKLALAHFDRSLKSDPANALAYKLRGLVHERLGNDLAAFGDFDEALRRGFMPEVGLIPRAQALHALGKYDEALADLAESLKVSPSWEAHLVRSGIWRVLGRTTLSASDAREALRLMPDKTPDDRTRGVAYLRAGDLDQAFASFDRAIETAPDCGRHYNHRGYVWHQRGDFARAIADYEAAIRLSPEQPNAYKNLAFLYATSADRNFRNGPQAVVLAQRALALRRRYQRDWLPLLANAYAEAGDFSAAQSLLDKAFEPGPRVPVTPPPFPDPSQNEELHDRTQFSIAEALFAVTVVGSVLTVTSSFRNTEFWNDVLNSPATPLMGLMALAVLVATAHSCWRGFRSTRPQTRLWYLGVVCGAPLGAVEGITAAVRQVSAAQELAATVSIRDEITLFLETIGFGVVAAAYVYAVIGGALSLGLNAAIKWTRVAYYLLRSRR